MTLRTFIASRDELPALETFAWLKRRILQAAPASGPYETYTLMLKTLSHLAHERDLSAFPADKVWRLFEKARERVGWVRTLPPPPVTPDTPPGHRCCPGCKEIKPTKKFNRLATVREREHYGWGGERRTLTDNYCQACRVKRASRLRRGAKARVFKHDPYTRLKQLLERKIKDTKRKEGEFYVLRLACLKQALLEVERRVDDGLEVSEECLSDWTLLLPEQQRECLFAAYQAVLEGRTAGRTPSL
jgi:hypothetical protein